MSAIARAKMHTVELLEEACQVLERLGYRVRTEALDSGEGGVCEFGGRKWLFLDAAANPAEHLRAVLEVLRGEFYIERVAMSAALRGLIAQRSAAA